MRPWLNEATGAFSDRFRRGVRELFPEPGRFYATTEDPGPFLLATHPGIRWERNELLLSGRVLAEPSTPETDE